MSMNVVVDPPALVAPPTRKSVGALLPTPIALAAPVAMSLIALAVHAFVPAKQQKLDNWLLELPFWNHPYPRLLAAIVVGSIAAGALYAVIRSLRPVIRNYMPLVAGMSLWTLAWEYTTVKTNWLRLPFFPGPDDVLGAMIEDSKILLDSSWHSLQLLAVGYSIGVVAGITTGVLIGWYPTVRYWAMPAVKFFGPIPATALLAVVFAIWKESFPGAAALIAFSVWFPVNILTSSGIANVRLSYLDVARTLGATERYLIFRVAIPAAMPNIFIGMFMGLVVSFVTLNVAEILGVPNGLGWYMRWRKDSFDYDKMYGSILICTVFFSLLLTLLFKLRDRVLVWQKGVIKW